MSLLALVLANLLLVHFHVSLASGFAFFGLADLLLLLGGLSSESLLLTVELDLPEGCDLALDSLLPLEFGLSIRGDIV